jgi:transposase
MEDRGELPHPEDRHQACPDFVWSDEHIRGHFALCFLALSMMRYLVQSSHEAVSAGKLTNEIPEKNMILTQFPSSTNLDLTNNLK